MLIHDYADYKIWESDQQARELRLRRHADGLDAKIVPVRLSWWSMLIVKFAGLI